MSNRVKKKPNAADMGKVSTHAVTTSLTVARFFLSGILTAPAPITADDFAWVVEAGMPKIDKMSNATADTRSEQKPKHGSVGAKVPNFLIIFRPPKSVPNEIKKALNTVAHNGIFTEPFCAAARLKFSTRIPANFCPSCAPWAKDESIAPKTCSFLKFIRRLQNEFCISFAAAKDIKTTGRVESNSPRAVLPHSVKLTVLKPSTATAAPVSAAASAWLSLVGSPNQSAVTDQITTAKTAAVSADDAFSLTAVRPEIR